ncbi:MAG: leucine-rich repeat protein [Ruminococcus sp.]|nr:leucine-rich repeat protein [Ruminococcus sp.]
MTQKRSNLIRLSIIVSVFLIVLAVAALTCTVSTVTFGSGGRAHRQLTPVQWEGNFTLKGSASYDSQSGTYQLTPNSSRVGGAILCTDEIGENFSVELDYFSGAYNGADGMGVAFYGDYTNSADPGWGDSDGFPSNLNYGVQIDTYCNSERNDPSYNHIALTQNNTTNHLTYAQLNESEDNQWHHLKIYVLDGTCSVYVDNNLKLLYNDLTYNDHNNIWISGATGGETNVFAVKNVEIYSLVEETEETTEAATTEPQPTASPESDFEWYQSGGNAIITKYKGNSANVVIPSTLGGYRVTGLANASTWNGGAFYEKRAIVTSITFPDTLTSIGSDACSYCRMLTSVTIPASVTNISTGAFTADVGLVEFIVDPNNNNYCSVDGVLYNKSKSQLIQYPASNPAKTFEMPRTVTSMSMPYTFYHCVNLEEITVESGNNYYSAQDGVLYDKNKTQLIDYPAGKTDSTFTVPSTVNTIYNDAFTGCKLTNLIIPSNVSQICDQSIRDSTTLKKLVVLRSGSMSIDNGGISINKDNLNIYGYSGSNIQSYANSKGYTFVTITSYENGYLNNNGAIVGYAGDSSDITIPSTVDRSEITSVAANAFKGEDTLDSVVFPSHVENVGAAAFKDCSNLKYATFLNAETVIADTAFDNHANDLTIYGYAGSTAETFANSKNINFVAITGSDTNTITITASYADAVNTDECKQTVEYYADTTKAATTSYEIANGETVRFIRDESNSTPTFNLKSNAKVSITSIVVKNAEGTDITADAFGSARYKTDFLESCKTSLFGFVEFQSITGNITVEVTYGAPTTMSSGKYACTIVTKGDVGPYRKSCRTDYPYPDLHMSGYTDMATSSIYSYNYYGTGYFRSNAGYKMRDGGQFTAYEKNSDYDSYHEILFDTTWYSYISDIKVYNNSTGLEVKDLSALAGKSYSNPSNNRKLDDSKKTGGGSSITYVVTYKAMPQTAIYTSIRWKTTRPSSDEYKVTLSGDEGARFATNAGNYNNSTSITSDNVLSGLSENNLYVQNNGTFYDGDNYPSNCISSGKCMMLDSDTVKYYYNPAANNSGVFNNIKVYALDIQNNVPGEQIAGVGCENPKVTLNVHDRTSWDDDGYFTISGLKAYGGDIYVTAEPFVYNTKIQFIQNGEHTDNLVIRSDDNFARAGGGMSNSSMGASVSVPFSSGTVDRWLYGGGTYTVSCPSGINSMSLTYTKILSNNNTSRVTIDNFGTTNADGSITFTWPSDFYCYNNTGYYSNTLTINYTPITTRVAQILPKSNEVSITGEYAVSNKNLVNVTTYENGEAVARMFNNSGGTKAVQSLNCTCATTTNTSYSTTYRITPQTTVKVKNIWCAESRSPSGTRPQALMDYVNRRLIFKDVKVYNASTGAEVPCTKDGDYYVFTMPNYNVRIEPRYEHNVRAINIFSNQKNGDSTFPIGAGSSRATATLTGDDNNWFLGANWFDFNSSYVDTDVYCPNSGNASGYGPHDWVNAAKEWGNRRYLTLDGSYYTFTVTPKEKDNYEIRNIKAYKYSYNQNAQNNYIFKVDTYWQHSLTDSTSDWLTYDDDGNITNTDITADVISNLSAPDETTGARTCRVTVPDNLDVGNIALWVETVPITRFAHFDYVKGSSATSLNPPVKLKGVFKNAETAEINATNGAETEMSVYENNDASRLIKVEIGGDSTYNSVLYNHNLVYEIKDYTENTTRAKFSIYRNQIIPVDCTQDVLDTYMGTPTFTSTQSNGLYTKVVLPIKNTLNGLKLCYSATQPYAEVKINQHATDANHETVTDLDSFNVRVTKYPESAGSNYFAPENMYAADSFTESYTASGATDIHNMKLVNSSSEQGFEIKPIAPSHYVLTDNPITIKTISAHGVENTSANVTLSDIGDNTYRVTYTGSSGFSLMNAERIEIDINYEYTDLTYVPFRYTASGSFRPKTVFSGYIVGKGGTVDGTNNLNAVNVAKYDDEKKQCLTMIVGGDMPQSGNATTIFHQANLVYTVTDRNTSSPLLKFRIYRGEVIPAEGYTQEKFDQYIDSVTVLSPYNAGAYSGLQDRVTIRLKIPENGLSITGYAETAYLPVTVKQYVLDNNGNAQAADENFTTKVTRYCTSSTDLAVYKYFNKNDITDTAGLESANQDQFTGSYTLTGASDTHYMVHLNDTQGLYLMPSAPEGYDFATMEGKALNIAGNPISNTTHKQSLTDVPSNYTSDGYQIRFNSGVYMRGASIEVDVYYRPKTGITIKQGIDGTLDPTDVLSKITLTTTTDVDLPFKAYTKTDKVMLNTFEQSSRKDNYSGIDENRPGLMFHNTYLSAHRGVVPQIKIEPQGARNVSAVKIYKKNNSTDEYEEVPDTAYTTQGTGNTGSYITYTFTNAIEFGDDYVIDIVYGRQQLFTVKAVMRNASGQETEINDNSTYNQSGLDKITVTGQRYDIYGNDTTDRAFSTIGDQSETFDDFELTNSSRRVNCETNTRVSIATTLKQNSQYVIANIIAYDNDNNNLNLVVAGKKTVGEGQNQRTETTYENSTLPSLSSPDNVIVKIILTKVATVRVNVFTILADGTTAEPGTPREIGNRSDAFINVSATSGNSVNQKAIITSETEGKYYTGDFDITYAPNSRTVSVLEGAYLNVFAQLPGDGDYVVSRITCDGAGYQNIGVSSITRTGSGDNTLIKETLNTGSTVIQSEKGTYELNIYIQKARSIHTLVATEDEQGNKSPSVGTCRVRGSHAAAGAIPFMKLEPMNETVTTSFNAVYSGPNTPWEVEAKAIRDTKITLEVKPPNRFAVKTVSVKRGTSRENAQPIGVTASAPADDGTIYYTVNERMSPNEDLYVYVAFTATYNGSGTVEVDYQYTDDYQNYHNMFDPVDGIASMEASVGTAGFGAKRLPAKNLVTGDEKYSWSGDSAIQYSTSSIPASITSGRYKFEVGGDNGFSIRAVKFKNSGWYLPVEGECGVYNADTGAKISNFGLAVGSDGYAVNIRSTEIDKQVQDGDHLLFRLRLAPCSKFKRSSTKRNGYGDSSNATKGGGSVYPYINASKPETSNQVTISHPILGYGRGNDSGWLNYGSSGVIMMGSKINSVDVPYDSSIDPGVITKVTLYEYDKNNNVTGSWVLNPPRGNSELRRYTLDSPITVEKDKVYETVVDYDLITVNCSIGPYSYPPPVKSYIYYGSGNIADINISTLSSDEYIELGSKNYADGTINQKTKAYWVLVSDLSKDDCSLTSATFNDYAQGKSEVDIKDEMLYTIRPHNGITKYYYIYEINPEDEHPIDNSISLSCYFTVRTDNYTPSSGETNYDCDVTVEQWNRDTYDGNYVTASGQTVQFSVKDGDVLRVGNKSGRNENPLSISESTGSLYCERSSWYETNPEHIKYLYIKPIPQTGYNVERIEITDNRTYSIYPSSFDENGRFKFSPLCANVKVRVYYSRPLIRLSATNEGSKSKAAVDVYNTTEGTTETVLNENTFTNGTFVTKGDETQVIIRPLTYIDEGTEYYYSVASIRIGSSYNNTTTVYTDSNGDKPNDGYTIEKMPDNSQYLLTMGNVQGDKYIFIQLVGKERILTSNVQVKQQIRFAGTDEYVDCSEGSYGSVTLNGALSGNDKPMNFDGEDRSSVTMNDEASIEGTVINGTTLSLSNITPPEGGYIIDSIDVDMNNYPTSVAEDNGTYTLNTSAPDSGSTVITVKYDLKRTVFNLNYKYYSREWNADEESNYENNNKVIGENTQPDKTYTVSVSLTDADIKDGKIANMRVFVENAPAIDDLYKDCKFNKFDDDHVIYNGTEVTILAEQPAKEFVVKFYKNDGDNDDLETLSKVKLNGFAKKDGEFITADETLNGSKFAYWLVKKAGTDKEITKCYSRKFNSRVTENIDVVAYYGEQAKSITLSDATYSREQTSDGKGNISDKLFADFILSYMDETGRLFNASAAASEGVEALEGYRSGLIVEFDSEVKLEREDEAGHKLTDQEKVVFPANDTVDKNTIISYIKGENPDVPNTRTLLNLAVNNNSYNNKNRVDKALSFNNSENARHTVLRAYYYVVDAEGNVQLTDPVYFYLYDIGNSVA